MGIVAGGREPASQKELSPTVLRWESWCVPGAEGRLGPEELGDVLQEAEQ